MNDIVLVKMKHSWCDSACQRDHLLFRQLRMRFKKNCAKLPPSQYSKTRVISGPSIETPNNWTPLGCGGNSMNIWISRKKSSIPFFVRQNFSATQACFQRSENTRPWLPSARTFSITISLDEICECLYEDRAMLEARLDLVSSLCLVLVLCMPWSCQCRWRFLRRLKTKNKTVALTKRAAIPTTIPTMAPDGLVNCEVCFEEPAKVNELFE